MADIFISYASDDRGRIAPIVKALEEQGWSLFWDWTSIPVGKTWRKFIKEGLDDAKCVLVLWSEKSITSEWVIEEADHGKINRMLLPARIDDVRPPIGFGQIQAADLINWKGDIGDPEFKRLVNSIDSIIGSKKTKDTKISDLEKEVLRVLQSHPKFTRRSITGIKEAISQKMDVGREQVRNALNNLAKHGFVNEIVGTTGTGARWSITNQGKAIK